MFCGFNLHSWSPRVHQGAKKHSVHQGTVALSTLSVETGKRNIYFEM